MKNNFVKENLANIFIVMWLTSLTVQNITQIIATAHTDIFIENLTFKVKELEDDLLYMKNDTIHDIKRQLEK